jgi:hypothetical protein
MTSYIIHATEKIETHHSTLFPVETVLYHLEHSRATVEREVQIQQPSNHPGVQMLLKHNNQSDSVPLNHCMRHLSYFT